LRSLAAPLILLGVAALLSSGCGGVGQTGLAKGSGADVGRGKQLFVSKCGSCHTLADAGTSGTIGPNLDGALAGPRMQHFKESTIRQVVYDQIYHAAPGGVMPAKIVTGADASDVAAYVASVAGTGSASQGAPPTLTAAPPSSSGGGAAAAAGAKLFASLGCSGCHSLTGATLVGPTFKGLYGSKVTLSTGQTVTADDAYLLQSIQDPDAKIVKGFPKGVMSATIRPGSVPEAKAKQLIAFIKSKK
jgi:mono/diheme cytochrome c family protein